MAQKTKVYTQAEYEKFVGIFEETAHLTRQYLAVGKPGPKFVIPNLKSFKEGIQKEIDKLP